jgi:hypothetical protein
MARKAGQIIARGASTWLVRVYLGRDAQTGTRKYHNQPFMARSARRSGSSICLRLPMRKFWLCAVQRPSIHSCTSRLPRSAARCDRGSDTGVAGVEAGRALPDAQGRSPRWTAHHPAARGPRGAAVHGGSVERRLRAGKRTAPRSLAHGEVP